MERRGLLSDILDRVAGTGRLLSLGREAPSLQDQCLSLLGDQGEASALASAVAILDQYETLDEGEQRAFFTFLATELDHDAAKIEEAIARWSAGDSNAARDLHFAAEPPSQELIRRLNQVPGATARLVGMRADLLKHLRDDASLASLDLDFKHLFSSWFNRGFLEIRGIDWSTPAKILEKIISYEAVHEITGWDDLRRRVAEPDRRLFAYFHPAMPAEPLIFVEVALTEKIPGAITDILSEERTAIDPRTAKTAVFYSISNCQRGLRGVSFGSFLIKQVVAELKLEIPSLNTFVTLSPIPGLTRWADTRPVDDQEALRLAAKYLTTAKRDGGTVRDPVAHFHLGNGAILHALHANADPSVRGQESSWGVMVNYLYDEKRIEAQHQAYATTQDFEVSGSVRALAK